MPRTLKPCGTPAAARRHRRAGEPPCEACVRAVREEKSQARLRAREEAAQTLASLPPVRVPASRLEDALDNLATVTRVMESGLASAQAPQLSKRRQELQEYIAELRGR